MANSRIQNRQRLSMAAKNAHDKQWYKDFADELEVEHENLYFSDTGNNSSEYSRMKINYDLFNNILNDEDFKYICQPFGEGVGDLPAQMVNRDIVSGKIKALLGMEMKRAFNWKSVATNKEATTRKEQAETKKLRDYVIDFVMKPIREAEEAKMVQELEGRELSQQEKQQFAQELEANIEAQTPEKVRKYMERDHQDPAEVLSHQLLEYFIQNNDIKRKFNDMFKHLHLSAKELAYVGIINGHPDVWVVNPIRFTSDTTQDLAYIEDGEFGIAEYRMLPSEVAKYFGDELTPTELDEIYADFKHYKTDRVRDSLFAFNDDLFVEDNDNTVRVLHCTFKSLRELHFLTYMSKETGKEEEMIVDEDYKLSKENGDLYIETEWIPETYEVWKIGTDKYAKMRPIPGQLIDMDNLYNCKLPYYGAICDNMNSAPTCIMDRLKVYQYYFNVVMYRIELLMATDKGKKILMNIGAIPDSAGIDVEKFQYLMESTPFMWFDPAEEGNEYADVNTVAKTIDLSLASDIGKYVELAEYLKKQCGESVGITPQVEGQFSAAESVTNGQQALVQSSHILEPYFDLHNNVKRNVLQALLDCAKVAYGGGKEPIKLNYVLDDMSKKMLSIDPVLLSNSTLGIFVSNNSKAEESLQSIKQLTHAAMQNQKVELSDVISVMNQSGTQEAEETLKASEAVRREHEIKVETEKGKQAKELKAMDEQNAEKAHDREKEMVILKEEEKRKTEVMKAGMMAASFNPDQDVDNDGQNDFIELAKNGLDADIRREKNQIDKDKILSDKDIKEKELKLKSRELDIKEKELAKKTPTA